MRVAFCVGLAGLVAGCAYFNGLYNAKHLAKEARHAESRGRTGEARSYWAQAAVKAESVVARYPHSKYFDDALVLQGVALARVDACGQAIEPLRRAIAVSPDSTLIVRARLVSAECRLMLRQPDSVALALGPLPDRPAGAIRDTALYYRGRARLALGKPGAALHDLERSRVADARFPQVVALVQLGRAGDAVALLDTTASTVRQYDDTTWLAVLDTLGRADGEGASAVTDRLLARRDLTVGERGRLLVADGRRWLTADSAGRADPRFAAAAAVARDSVEGRTANAYLLVEQVRKADHVGAVDSLLAALTAVIREGGTPVAVAGPAVNSLQRVTRVLHDTAGPDPLRLFVAAGEVRDSIGAPGLAAALFRYVATIAPNAVIAPKALLAAAALEPAAAESLVTVVQERYPTSVYVLALRGEAGAAYQAVEDSLRQVLEASGALPRQRGEPFRPGAGRPGAAAGVGRGTARDTTRPSPGTREE